MLQNVSASTPVDVPTAVPSDLSSGARQRSYPANSGLARALNEAWKSGETADLVLVTTTQRLPTGWLGRLRSAAHGDDIVGAATALTSDLVSALGEARPEIWAGQSRSQADGQSTALHPYVSFLPPWCSYIRQRTLQLVGGFDESISEPSALFAEFSARLIARGFVVSLATDVLVLGAGNTARDEEDAEKQEVERRHPWLSAAHHEEEALEVGPLRRALVATRAAERPLTVTIDARGLGVLGGTQTHIGGLVAALAREQHGSVRAVVRNDAPGSVIDWLAQRGLEVVREGETAGLPRTDIAHRPQQAFVPEDLSLLRRVGERVVITHHDLIAFRNPAYHASPEEWRRFRRLTRFALSAADRVVFVSEHARQDALQEELIEPHWTEVVGGAVDAKVPAPTLIRPPELDEGKPFLVVIGADYLHKNRLFALELFDALRTHHAWDGLLVFAGPHVPHGGSADEERALLGHRPALAEHVLDLGRVEEAEKQWLLRHAAALLCPSTYEGFGLTPLEAAAAGIPCIYGGLTSLKEVVGEAAATIIPWDAIATAALVAPLLVPGAERERHIALLGEAARRHSWTSVAHELEGVYRRAIASPYRSSVPRAWEELEREQLIVDIDRARDELNEKLVDLTARVHYGLALIDRGGLLTRRQQRGLMRVASRPWLRAPVLGPLGLLGRTRSDGRES